MDDRNKDLTHLFVRDIDEIPLPRRDAWRPVRTSASVTQRAARVLLSAGVIAAVLAVALVVGYQLNQRQQGVAAPSASPTPRDTGLPFVDPRASASVGPTATVAPSGAGGFNDDFGFVLAEPGAGRTTTVRRESGARLGTFDQEQFAVSPDGRQIAYFTPFSAQPQQLRVASAGDPGRSQLVRILNASEHGGTIVWANDASGLLYQTYSVEPSSAPGNPSFYAIHEFDMRNRVSPERVVLTSPIRGLVLQPIALDRAANVAAVVETGEGGFMGSYDVLRFTGSDVIVTKAPAPIGQVLAFSTSASSDAKLVLAATFENGGSLSWWPLADFGGRKTITGARTGLWRPQTHEVATIGGCAGDAACGPNGGVRLLDVDKGTSRIVYGASIANMSLRMFRADGSAVILAAPQPPGANLYDYTLVPLSGAAPVTFKDVNGLLASVRLR